MSKMLSAICRNGKVIVEETEIPTAEILSEGHADSSGVLFLDNDQAKYFPKNSADLKSTLELISTALANIASALSTIDNKTMTVAGPLAGPTPIASAIIAQINQTKSSVDTLKGSLK